MAIFYRIPSAREPLNDQSGLASQSWYRFWEYLSQWASGGLSPSDVFIDEATNDSGTAQVTRKTEDALLLAWLNDVA